MRVVIDTNVFASSVLGGALAEILNRWRAGQFTLIVTDEIVREYLEVLRRPKFALPIDVVDTISLRQPLNRDERFDLAKLRVACRPLRRF